jgi:2-oxo-4-hydroxy-4-carboxy-5-ureidoimidazoline decarboxylase
MKAGSSSRTAITLRELNELDRDGFVSLLGAAYEHSPWVAQRAWSDRPFDSVAGLWYAMQSAVEAATPDAQLALIRAHPELGGRLAVAGRLTDASRREQAGAGLDQCTPEEFVRLRELNTAYRERFDLPFIVAVRGLTRADIIARLERRLANSPDEERATSLHEIGRIARFRLEDLVRD